jgi:hypothetical protein
LKVVRSQEEPEHTSSLPVSFLPFYLFFVGLYLRVSNFNTRLSSKAHQRLFEIEMDSNQDIWLASKPLIKQLYEVERKTLKEVKFILEAEHGFPETSLVMSQFIFMYCDRVTITMSISNRLSIYETKFRDQFGFRKRLKSGDWPRIYHYARSKGFSKFDVYLNGCVIPERKVWKELRRSGVMRLNHHGEYTPASA